jgi:ring-1,2-phenylacetyl-CoA epoxidase subunit PaaC
MGDNTLVLGHRVSEWCGHAPVLEEDIALANTALDLIGQTTLWLDLAGKVEDAGRDADRLAFHRDVWDFRNLLLVEQPNGDFGQTIMRQFLFDAWHLSQLTALMQSSDAQIAAIAEKSSKEVTYHLERATDTVIGLGDGTDESHRRMQNALDLLWPYPASLRPAYDTLVNDVFTAATLTRPESDFGHRGGKSGKRHSEHLGHMLTQMQWLQRAYPDATW